LSLLLLFAGEAIAAAIPPDPPVVSLTEETVIRGGGLGFAWGKPLPDLDAEDEDILWGES
jgi:hypothetical protein